MAWDFVQDPLEVGDKPSGLKESLKAGIASASAGLNAIPAAAGSDEALREMREQQRISANASQRAAAGGIPQSVGDIHGPVDVLRFAGGQALQAAPVLGEAALGSMIAGPVGAVAAVAPSTIGGNLAAQYEHNQTFNAPAAIATGIPQAALMSFAPEARLFQRGVSAVEGAALETGSRAGNALVRGGVTGASQAANMGATAAFGEINTAGADPNYDLFGDQSMKNIGEATAGGFIAGSLIGAGHGVIKTPVKGEMPKPGELPTTDATSPDVNPSKQWELLDSPTYQRQGIPFGSDGLPTGDAQRVLDLKGGQEAGPFKPGFDAMIGVRVVDHRRAIVVRFNT